MVNTDNKKVFTYTSTQEHREEEPSSDVAHHQRTWPSQGQQEETRPELGV